MGASVAHPFCRNTTPNIFFAGPDTLTSIDPVCVTKNLGSSPNPGIPSHRILLSEPRCSKTALPWIMDVPLFSLLSYYIYYKYILIIIGIIPVIILYVLIAFHCCSCGLQLLSSSLACCHCHQVARNVSPPVTAIPFGTRLLSAKTGFCLACAAAAALILMQRNRSKRRNTSARLHNL